MSLSIIVISVHNRDTLTDIYGLDVYRKLSRDIVAAVEGSVGRAPRESGELPGSFLLVLPGLDADAAMALGWHVDRSVPLEVGEDGLLTPVELEIVVETHDGSRRVIERLGTHRSESSSSDMSELSA